MSTGKPNSIISLDNFIHYCIFHIAQYGQHFLRYFVSAEEFEPFVHLHIVMFEK